MNIFCALVLASASCGCTVYAWFAKTAINADFFISGGYNSVYFDEISGNGFSATFTGESDQMGKKVGPYILTRPSHLYNLSKLQESGFDDVVVNGNHYYFQLGLPIDDSGDICMDANGKPDYASANISTYKVYNDNTTTSLMSETLNMQQYVDEYALVPIGTTEQPFESNFYGNDIEISALNVVATNGKHAGMFGYVSNYLDIEGQVQTSILKDFTLVNPVITATESASPTAQESYVGYAIGYLRGGDVSGIGIYNGRIQVQTLTQRISPYKSEYGYIGKSTIPIFDDESGGGGGTEIDANLHFTNIANAIPVQFEFARKKDTAGNITQLSTSPMGTGGVNLNTLIPDSASQWYDKAVFSVNGGCTFFTTYSDDYAQYTQLIPGQNNSIPSDSVPFLKQDGTIAPPPGEDTGSFYLTQDMVTGLWGASSSMDISFTTTGAGNLYFAYALSGLGADFRIDIFNENDLSTPIATSQNTNTSAPRYTPIARVLSIPEAGTYKVEISAATTSPLLYMRFRMKHELGDIGETGSVSNVDYTYTYNGGYAKVSADTASYTNSRVWLSCDLTNATEGQFVLTVSRPSAVASVTYYASQSVVTVKKGTATPTSTP